MFGVSTAIELGSRWILAFVFLLSAAIHLSNPYEFMSAIYGYQIGHESIGEAAAIAIPFLLAGAGGALLFGFAVEAAFSTAIGLLIVFSAAQISVIWRGITADCGCFGMAGSSPVDRHTLVRLGLLLVIAIIGLSLAIARRRFRNLIETTTPNKLARPA